MAGLALTVVLSLSKTTIEPLGSHLFWSVAKLRFKHPRSHLRAKQSDPPGFIGALSAINHKTVAVHLGQRCTPCHRERRRFPAQLHT